MSCELVDRSLSAYIDGRLTDEQRRAVAWHLAHCEKCAVAARQLLRLRATLRVLPQPTPPPKLTVALRIMASREASRRATQHWLGSFLGPWVENFSLRWNALMRPLAVPFAGGLVSALLVFATFVPMYTVREKSSISDVPTGLFTEATLKSVPSMDLSDDELVVDLVVDGQGRIVDYTLPHGQSGMKNAQVRRAIENALLFTSFTPSTTFGQPISTRIRLSFRRSQIEVKG
jgi:hypothetical protein